MMLPDTKARARAAALAGQVYGPPSPKKTLPKKAIKKGSSPTRVAPSISLTEPVESSPLDLGVPDPLTLTPRLSGRQFLSAPSRAGAQPGDIRINELGLDQDLSRGKSRNAYHSAPAYNELHDAAMSTDSNQALLKGIEDQQQLYRDILTNMPTSRDLTPLMAWSDSLTGSKFAQSYRAPASYDDRAKMLMSMNDTVQGSKERLAQLIMNETGGLKAGVDEEGYKAGLNEDQKSGFNVPRPNAPRMGQFGGSPTNVRGFYNTFENSDTVKEASKSLQAANAVRGHLNNPNWLGDSAARAGILAAMRLAPVSNLDVQQITGSKDLYNQFNQLTNRLANGDIFTEEDRETIENYASYLQKKYASDLDRAADDYSRAHAPFYGFDYSTGRQLLKPAIPRAEIPEAAPPSNEPTFLDLMRSMRQNRGGK